MKKSTSYILSFIMILIVMTMFFIYTGKFIFNQPDPAVRSEKNMNGADSLVTLLLVSGDTIYTYGGNDFKNGRMISGDELKDLLSVKKKTYGEKLTVRIGQFPGTSNSDALNEISKLQIKKFILTDATLEEISFINETKFKKQVGGILSGKGLLFSYMHPTGGQQTMQLAVLTHATVKEAAERILNELGENAVVDFTLQVSEDVANEKIEIVTNGLKATTIDRIKLEVTEINNGH